MSNACLKLFLCIIVFYLFSSHFVPHVYATHQCGNGVCQPTGHHSETCSSCPQDCGACPVPTATPTPQPTNTPVPQQPTNTSAPGQPTSTPAPTSASESSSSSSSTSTVTYHPSVSLNSFSPNPTNQRVLSYSGSTSIEQGSVASIEYSTDGSNWSSAPVENNRFSFSTPSLSEGVYTIQVKAKSAAGVTSQSTTSDTVTIATTPPTVILDEISPNPTKNQSPIITGNATAKLVQIRSVEVSNDGGKSWIAATQKGSTFTASFKNLEDGNYPIIARAIDSVGNIGQSKTQTLVVDTIPPIIGGSMFSIGPQTLTPNANGSIALVAGTPVTISVHMKGGVTKATLSRKDKKIPLTAVAGTHLFSGTTIFEQAGEEPLFIMAIDGAGNETKRELNTVAVQNYGEVVDKKEAIADATITVYYFDTISTSWVIWDGASFGQKNPQKTNLNGRYSFMLPPGRYYVEVTASGYYKTQSEIITLSETTVINATVETQAAPHTTLTLPILGKITFSLAFLYPPKTYKIPATNEKNTSESYTLKTGTPMPAFSLPNSKGNTISSTQLKGKKTLVTFFAPWSPLSVEQAPILSKLSQKLRPDETILGVSLQESPAATETFMKRGNYTFPVVADQNGLIANDYRITVLPQHFFISTNGTIEQIYTGVLSEKELLEKMAELP